MSRRVAVLVTAFVGVLALATTAPGTDAAPEVRPALVAVARAAPRAHAVPRPVSHVPRLVRVQTGRSHVQHVAPARTRRPGCDDRPGWEQVRGARAVAALGYPVARLHFTVQFLPAQAGYTGLTDAGARRIQLFVRPCAQQSDASLLFTYAHEVGHAIDAAHLSAQRHTDWMRARGRSGAVWFGCGGCDDFATGAGDFAETFALWRTGDVGEYHSRFAPRPTPQQLVALAPMFDVDY